MFDYIKSKWQKPKWQTVREFAIDHAALNLLIDNGATEETLNSPVITKDFKVMLLKSFKELRGIKEQVRSLESTKTACEVVLSALKSIA